MSLHINFPAVDHSEVASDERKLWSDIFAICAKALFDAENKMEVYHVIDVIVVRERRAALQDYIARFNKNTG